MDLGKLSKIADSIGGNGDISKIKELLIATLKAEPGTVLHAKINGVEVTSEKEEGSDWDPDFGNLDYSGAQISAGGVETGISKEDEIDFAISLLYDALKLKPSAEEENLINEVQKAIDIDYNKIITFDDNVYVVTEFGEFIDEDLLESVGLRFVKEKIMPEGGEMAYTVFKFSNTNHLELSETDSHTLSKRHRNSRVSDPEDNRPDYTNRVVYDLESEENGYTLEADNNVLYLYVEATDQPRGQMWIDKFGKTHIEDYSDEEPLTASERKILEEVATKAEGKYDNEFTDADISIWAIEHEFTTPHIIENGGYYWALTFNDEPTDAEIELMRRHKIEFNEDYEEWS